MLNFINLAAGLQQLIEDYSFAMGDVDVIDPLASTFRVLRKVKKYWKSILYDFVEVAVINSGVT